jgi:PAS domain S-box-containing protein
MTNENQPGVTRPTPPPRVLVVEDESITALHLKTVLVQHGYEVGAIAKSGREAIEKTAEFAPDLVLMDISLHGEMDGVEAAEVIARRFDRPVIYLTAYADRETTERARLTGPHGYLLKPFDETELLIAVEMALYRHQMEARLKDSERWLTATLRNIGDAVIATDDLWRISFMNPRAESLTGWEVQDAQGRELAEILRVTITTHPHPISSSFPDRGGGRAQGVLISRDGREVAVEETSTTIRNDLGSVIGAVIAIRERQECGRPEDARADGGLESSRQSAVLAELEREIRPTLAAILDHADLLAGRLKLLAAHGQDDQDKLLRGLKLSCERLIAAVETALARIENEN